MNVLTVNHLVAGYPQGFRSRPLSLSICEGERVGIVGPNGSGKSVLIKTLLGLLPALAGEMTWAKNCRIGFVPQFHDVNPLLPITVAEVL